MTPRILRARALSLMIPAWLLCTTPSPAAAQDQLWIRQFGTSMYDVGEAAASDAAGGVYVSGTTTDTLGGSSLGLSDAWLARYDATGNELWIRQFGTSTFDLSSAAAPDGSGGVYVGGGTYGSLGGPHVANYDVWLARYDSAGSQLWIRQFGTIGDDTPFAAAPDGSGGVFVSGTTQGDLAGSNAGDFDVWLARYDGTGNQLWIRQFGTVLPDDVDAAGADDSGGVYVAGTTQGDLVGPNAGSSDAWLARYDGAGNLMWIRQFGTSALDSANAAAPDGTGGVYIGGQTAGSLGGPTMGPTDAWLARYDSAGNQLWIEQEGSGAHDYLRAAAPDASGDLFLLGFTLGSLGAPNAGEEDVWLAAYDRSEIRAYCFGDGSGGMCPCGNLGATGEGCANPSAAGALVSSIGSNSVSADDLAFVTSNLLPSQAALLFAGLDLIDGGDGVAFGDGLRCTGGSVVRLGVQLPDAQGNATFGPGISASGGFSPGDQRRFQVRYRDPSSRLQCGTGFNLSHGMEVLFVP